MEMHVVGDMYNSLLTDHRKIIRWDHTSITTTLKLGLVVSGDVIIAVTDEDPAVPSQNDTSYALCSVVTSPFKGLARCDVSDAYGQYVFVKARPKLRLRLCEVEVFAFRKWQYIARLHCCVYSFMALNRIRVTFLRMRQLVVFISFH